MHFRALRLPDAVPGQVWLSSMPGRLEPWSAFLAEAERVGLTRVVCLTPLHEVASLSPEYRASLDEQTFPFGWQHLPMRDFGLALDAEHFRDAVDQAAERVLSGDSVLLHCAAGIGRTGTFAACLLKRLSCPQEIALEWVRMAGANPQSALQSGLIALF